jgi:undecaprenyl diphosphate synthase
MAFRTSSGVARAKEDSTGSAGTSTGTTSRHISGMEVLCRRRRHLQASVHGASVGAMEAVKRAMQAAASAAGAAGSGWALLAAAHALLRPPALQGAASQEATVQAEAAKVGDGMVVPQHIAVIMDGNRRYGRRVHGDSISGHRAGGEKLRDFIEWCAELDVKHLTVFAFSTENWKRAANEVDAMMKLFLQEVPRLGDHANRLNAKVRFLTSEAGQISAEVKEAISELEENTARNSGLQVNVCLSYGGRSDVVHAVRVLAEEMSTGKLNAQDIDESLVSKRLLTGDSPDPDVLIRTSGEKRMSNFLIYQCAYSEMFFLDKHWPEVTRQDLLDVVDSFGLRHRRFGK